MDKPTMNDFMTILNGYLAEDILRHRFNALSYININIKPKVFNIKHAFQQLSQCGNNPKGLLLSKMSSCQCSKTQAGAHYDSWTSTDTHTELIIILNNEKQMTH